MFRAFDNIQPRFLRWIPLAALLLALDVFLGFRYSWVLALALLLAAVAGLAWLGWRAAARFRQAYQQRQQMAEQEALAASQALQAAQERLLQAQAGQVERERQLNLVMRLNRGLAQAQDEQSLMDFALSEITGLVGALGCSFVPVDEWNQPLPAFTYGQLPEPVLRAWATHLASHLLSERCGSCQLLVGPPGECPLHPAEAGDTMRVYCIPLTSGNGLSSTGSRVDISVSAPLAQGQQRPLGILHLYLAPGRALDASQRAFLEQLVQEIAMAYQSTRLRAQELSTFRQLHLLHASQNDFIVSLSSLLEGLKQALEADCVLIRLRPSSDERLSNLNVLSGTPCGLDEEQLEAIFTGVVASASRSALSVREQPRGEPPAAASEPGELPVWLALPLVLPEGQPGRGETATPGVLGMLMTGSMRPQAFHPRQQAILQTVAAQAALLIEHERMLRALEYTVLIQERARLAREIHDGLAQTLAYLKLQAAQMQSYLSQGDLSRLSQVLKDNYRVLTDAYLDTRQAIDNLRLTPLEGLETWLGRIIDDFENTTHISVQRAIQAGSGQVTPEVQAHLIRIVQEALSNIRKHARASQVSIQLREWQENLVIEVHDDGLGFDVGDVPEISRHGLRGMRERAEMIGADFQITSQALQGTTVRLVLPLSLEEETLQ